MLLRFDSTVNWISLQFFAVNPSGCRSISNHQKGKKKRETLLAFVCPGTSTLNGAKQIIMQYFMMLPVVWPPAVFLCWVNIIFFLANSLCPGPISVIDHH